MNHEELMPLVVKGQIELHLKYAILLGTTLALFDDVPQSVLGDSQTPNAMTKEEYVIQRKYGIVEEDHERM